MNQQDTDYLNQISNNVDAIFASITDQINSQDIKQNWQKTLQ